MSISPIYRSPFEAPNVNHKVNEQRLFLAELPLRGIYISLMGHLKLRDLERAKRRENGISSL